jgi:hypothetical protein
MYQLKSIYIIGLPIFSEASAYSLKKSCHAIYTVLSATGEPKLQVSANELSKQKCSAQRNNISYKFTCLELPNVVTALLLTFVNKSGSYDGLVT